MAKKNNTRNSGPWSVHYEDRKTAPVIRGSVLRYSTSSDRSFDEPGDEL